MKTKTLLLALLAACGNDDTPGDDAPGGDDARPGPDAAPAPYCTPRSGSNLRLQLVADGLENPVAVAAPNADSRVFIVEQPGRIRVVKGGVLLPTPFLSIDVNDLGNEQGLLGLAFHPQYATNGRFFVHYIRPGSNDIRIAEYHADPGADVAETAETVVLDVPHPGADNHNGGTLVFGPDGALYASLGDGGGANNFYENAQDPDSLLAKVQRIDVDNGNARSTYAWGLRNPWKIAFDSATGDLWIGDVGQGAFEEVDVVRAGQTNPNFGWAVFEGPECFTDDPDGAAGCDTPGNYVMPVMAYDRRATEQCSVVVAGPYRGTCMPDFVGRVFFGDWCSGEVRSFPASSTSIAYADTTDHSDDVDPQNLLYGRLSAFGVDGYQELYVTSLAGGAVYRLEAE